LVECWALAALVSLKETSWLQDLRDVAQLGFLPQNHLRRRCSRCVNKRGIAQRTASRAPLRPKRGGAPLGDCRIIT